MPKKNTKQERKERGLTEKKHRSVILFGEWQRPLGALSLEQKGMLLDALLAYPEGKRPDFTDPMLRMAWTFMEGGLDENARKWEETRQRRAEAGTKGPRAAGTAKSVAKIANAMRRWQRWLYLVLIPSLILVLHLILSLSLILSSRMGRLTALTRPSRPRASPIFVRRTRVKSGTTLSGRAERRLRPTGSGRSMNPTAGGWVRTPCGTGRQRPRSGWPATGSGRLPPRRTSRKTRHSMPPARLSRQKTF